MKGVLSGFQVYLKEVQREFQGGFKGFSMKFQWCFKEFLSVFREDSRVLQSRLKAFSI